MKLNELVDQGFAFRNNYIYAVFSSAAIIFWTDCDPVARAARPYFAIICTGGDWKILSLPLSLPGSSYTQKSILVEDIIIIALPGVFCIPDRFLV